MPHSSRQIRLPATKSNALIAVVSELRGGERSPEVVASGARRDGDVAIRSVGRYALHDLPRRPG
jgi:hypothetical protein